MYKIIKIQGSKCITDPVHPFANSRWFYKLDRIVLSNKLWRELEVYEVVEYIDWDKKNVTPKNLRVKEAKLKTYKIKEVVCHYCWKTFKIAESHFIKKMSGNKSWIIVCSRNCEWKL